MHKVAIGCAPNAVNEKKALIKYLTEKGYELTDLGSDDPIYANIAIKVGAAVASGEYDRGILICGTGIGVSLAANKVPGVLAALVSDVYSAERARKSNDANVVCFGAFTIGIRLMEKLAETFLTSEFEPGCPSQPKVDRIREYEATGK